MILRGLGCLWAVESGWWVDGAKIDNMQREFAQTKRCNKYKLHGKGTKSTKQGDTKSRVGGERVGKAGRKKLQRGGQGRWRIGAADNGYG